MTGRLHGSAPVAWMLGAAAAYAALPWLVWSGVRDLSPWVFTAAWFAAYGVLFGAVRQMSAQEDARRTGRLVMIGDLRAARPGLVGLLALFQMSWLLFAAAVAFADPSVVAVVFESWPVLFGLITLSGAWKRLMLDSEPSERLRREVGAAPMLLMLAVGSAAAALVVISDADALSWSGRAPLGVLLALVASVAAAAGAATQQAVGKLQRTVPVRDMTAVSTSGNAAAQVLSVPLLVAAAAVTANTSMTARGLLFAAATGGTQMAGNWCLHHANHLAREQRGRAAAGINSLYYTVPVGALLLLAGTGASSIARPDLLIAGAAGVVAVNMVLHLDPERTGTRQSHGGQGYRAAVIALWGAAVLVLFRDDWLPASWQAWSVVEYWAMIGVLSTVFTLLFSFRQARLADLRRDCDELMLSLHQRLDAMTSDGRLPARETRRVMEELRKADRASRPADLAESYLSLRAGLAQMAADADTPERSDVRVGLLIDAERLVNLRQQGRGFAEPAVLAMFAAVTAAATIVVRPEGVNVPFAGWVHDTVSMIVASAFLFLGFDLIEKRHELDAPTLREVSDDAVLRHRQPPGWRLELAAYTDNRAERAISATLGTALLVGAITMLAVKWMG